MSTNSGTWQERFGLTTCAAAAIGSAIPPAALGVAVIYTARATGPGEQILLVIESRSTALRRQCERRLQTAKLPPLATLTIAFKADAPPDASPESVHASCRRQVTLAGEIRRELRPAMR